MKALSFFLILFFSSRLCLSQSVTQNVPDSLKRVKESNDKASYSLSHPEKIKLFTSPPAKNSIIVIDDKIRSVDYLRNFLPSSLSLIGTIRDTTSTTGIYYIYIYKTK
jgi:hypothetical protein